jgi:hypothetical protein
MKSHLLLNHYVPSPLRKILLNPPIKYNHLLVHGVVLVEEGVACSVEEGVALEAEFLISFAFLEFGGGELGRARAGLGVAGLKMRTP